MLAPLCVIAAVVRTAAMAYIVLCDTTMRLIPRNACIALALCGCIGQFARFGAAGLAAGAFWSCALAVSCLAAGAFVRAVPGSSSGRSAPIGGGDIRCMAALAFCSGAATPKAFAVAFLAAGAYAIVQRLRGRLLPGEPFPFAPFLAPWLLFA